MHQSLTGRHSPLNTPALHSSITAATTASAPPSTQRREPCPAPTAQNSPSTTPVALFAHHLSSDTSSPSLTYTRRPPSIAAVANQVLAGVEKPAHENTTSKRRTPLGSGIPELTDILMTLECLASRFER